MVYRETTNPPVATGDGMAAAYRAGAELRDMEFMQFHPDRPLRRRLQPLPHQRGGARRGGVPARQGRRPLHARRGPAGRAGPARRGRPGHRPPHGADAASQRLSRPVAPRPGDGARSASPASTRSAAASGWTSRSDPIPVRPGAHYMVGGVTVDLQGRTTLPGLWAAGEVTRAACTGPTGWRRTACSKAWSTARSAAAARRRRRRTCRTRSPCRRCSRSSHAGAAGHARRGRPDQLAAQPDGPPAWAIVRDREPACWRRSGR